MAQIINLPENIIGRKDRKLLESFGGHTIAHGRATHWHWHKADNGDVLFEIFRGGSDEVLAISVSRDREEDAFYAFDAAGRIVASGGLNHIMAVLEQYFVELHGK
ncbi:MAG: hypothetical protein RQ982_10685 [Gammaproteobacteria bacterium]|nr:hypothetical protein [Gammaproteobacteria bacterium]